jgi:hypothetical protein
MIHINVEGGNGLGKPRKGFKKFLKVAKIAVAPHTLLLKKKKNERTTVPVSQPQQEQIQEQPQEAVYGEEVGLGKSKMLKKIKLKTVIKQVGKVGKIVAPIAVGFIPVGGGVASKLLDSKIGKTAMKLGKSKVGSAVLSQAGVTLPTATSTAKPIPVKKKKGLTKFSPKKKTIATPKKTIATSPKPKAKFPVKFKKKTTAKTLAVGSKGEDVKVLQEQLGVEPDGNFGPKTQQALEQATGKKTISTEAMQTQPQQVDEEQPQGAITPIKPYEELPEENQQQNATATGTVATPKNNTLLLVGGAVALVGIGFLATRKK